MGELYVTRTEAEALKAIDIEHLRGQIESCLREEQWSALRDLRLGECGPYVASRTRAFERALSAYAMAKAAKKRAETGCDARKTGDDLEHAVQQMTCRVATEEQEGRHFWVEDHIAPPFKFNDQLNVRVRYRWREGPEAEWRYGNTTFAHNFVSRPNYMVPAPARKPSAAKQERDRQEVLCQEWEHLKSLGLHAIRDHFRQGGSGATLPEVVQAKTDPHSLGLNNFSAGF